MAINRRAFVARFAASATSSASLRANGDASLGFEAVVDAAIALARRDYAPPTQTPRAPFADLDDDHYRAMRFRHERRHLQGQNRGFTADMTPPGFLFRDGVSIAEVEGATVRPRHSTRTPSTSIRHGQRTPAICPATARPTVTTGPAFGCSIL